MPTPIHSARCLLFCISALTLAWLPPAHAGEKPKQEAGGIVVIDNAGKEVKLTTANFNLGVRRLAWLEKQPAKEGELVRPGPEYLAFREDNSTLYKEGILTLIPLSSIRKIDYDLEKKTVAVTFVNAEGKDDTVSGPTKYVGINKLEMEAEANIGGLGSAVVKYRGGDANGIRGIRFPNPQPVPAVNGATAKISVDDKEKLAHEAAGLTGLYISGAKSTLTPTIMFKKTVKVDLAKIKTMKLVPPDNPKETSSDYEVTLDDGEKHVLTLLSNTNPQDGTPAQFVGLVGRVPAGYKLFPPYTIAELQTAAKE